MARPQKNGVDYFPMDTGFFVDKKIKLLKGEFGACGLLIVLSTFCRVYSTNGYYASFDDDDAILTADELGCGITPNLVREVVQGSVKRSVFDEGVFNQFGVLTSPGIQRRFIRAASKRDDIAVFKEYWLLDVNDPNDVPQAMRNKITLKTVSDGRNPVNSTRNPFNSTENPQSKVKESKVKESKVLLHERPLAAAAVETDQRPDFNTIEAYASGNLRYLSPGNMEELASFAEDFPADMLRYAVDLAVGAGKPAWNYVRGILRSWKSKGFKTIGDARNEERPAQTSRSSYPAKPNPALQYEQRSHTESDMKDVYLDLTELYGEDGGNWQPAQK